MSLAEFARWLAGREWAMDFAASAYVYPIILATHLACIGVFGGMILMTNMRLLGWSLTSYSVSDVVDRLRNWKRVGFVIMITCGLLLAGSEADKYYANPYFWTKMTLLVVLGVHGLYFHRSVYYSTAELDQAKVLPSRAKVAAALSLILWVSVVCMGRLIGYYEGKEGLAARQVSHPQISQIAAAASIQAHAKR